MDSLTLSIVFLWNFSVLYPALIYLLPGISTCRYSFQDCERFLRSLAIVLNVVIQTLIYTLTSLNDLQKLHLLSKAEISPSSFIDSKGEERRERENKNERPQSQLRCMGAVRWTSDLYHLGNSPWGSVTVRELLRVTSANRARSREETDL